MQHQQGTFIGHGGLSLYMQSWLPDEPPKAVLILVHGLGEHSGRYSNLIERLVPAGYAVYTFDHRGHGRSPLAGVAHINRFAEYRGDVRAFVRLVKDKYPTLPCFLLGHSMGGVIVLNYVLHHPQGLDAVVASAPAVGELEISPVLKLLSQLFSRFWPRFSMTTPIEGSQLSRDPEVARSYETDPMVQNRASARFGTEMMAAAAWTSANAAKFQLPILVIHGDADEVVNIQGSYDFFNKVTQPDKKLIVYPDGRHESHNDLHHEQATADVLRWLEAHLP